MNAADGSAPSWLDWAGVLVIALCGVLAAFLEALLVPLYLGSVIFPVAVLFSLVSNAGLPRLSRALVPRTAAAIAPFLTWLAVMIFFGVLARPEGDVILPGAPTGAELVTYGVLLGGAIVGTVTIVQTSPPPPSRGEPRPRPQRGGRVSR